MLISKNNDYRVLGQENLNLIFYYYYTIFAHIFQGLLPHFSELQNNRNFQNLFVFLAFF